MRILAVDTTTARGSVALVEGDRVAGEVRLDAAATHSRRLLPAVAFLLEGLGLPPQDVEGFAVAAGPGSFTGLRIGLSTVQGLALGSGRPCLGLSALDVLAVRIRGAAPSLVALVDAGGGHVYARLYDREARPTTEPVAAALEELLAQVPDAVAFTGDGAIVHGDALRAARPGALFPDRSLFLAGTLGRLAEPRLVAGEGGPPDALRPLYLRPARIRQAGR